MLAQEKAMATPLGLRLKQIRENLGLSRSDVARRSNIDAAQLHRLENNDNAAPTFKTVVRLSRVLGVSLSWLAMAEDVEGEPSVSGQIVLDDELRRAIVLASELLQQAVASFSLPGTEPTDEQLAKAPVFETRSKPKRK